MSVRWVTWQSEPDEDGGVLEVECPAPCVGAFVRFQDGSAVNLTPADMQALSIWLDQRLVQREKDIAEGRL